MKFLDLITRLSIALIAIVFALLLGNIVPKKLFKPYYLKLEENWQKKAGEQEYRVNINNDTLCEKVVHHNINKPGNSIEYWHNNQLHQIYIFRDNEYFISRHLYIANINHDFHKDIIFVSARDNIAYLNILKYNADLDILRQKKKIAIDSISYFNNIPDITNNSITSAQGEIYFDLTAGYSIQPRKVYKYNITNDKLIKTSLNSFAIQKLGYINHMGKGFLLATEVKATGNTISHDEARSLKNSKSTDTLMMYEEVKHLEYNYGDFSSYVLLYNDNLKFAFEPIEFFGWTNYTQSVFVDIDDSVCIVSLTNTDKGSPENKMLTICDLEGRVIKQIPMDNDYTRVFSGNGKLVFAGNNTLGVYSNQLELIREIPDIDFCAGFYDLDSNGEKELIAFRDNRMLVFSKRFRQTADFKIGQEFTPYPELIAHEAFQVTEKHGFVFNSRLFYYHFTYIKNPLAALRYPFFILSFIFGYGIILFILKRNTKRLEREKRKLENTVAERTFELENKNEELAMQKEEIQTQAEKIVRQYEHLERLDHFKETLTHTLVHDLRNPLGQILLITGDQRVKFAAQKMNRLISNMLDVEKYENTGLNLNIAFHSLADILKEVNKGLELALRDKNQELRFCSPDYLISVDKELMIRVFDNLLANAIRFSPKNQIIEVFAENEGNDKVLVSVQNHGEKIDNALLPHIFDKYRHSVDAHKSIHQSTGLGLAFCKMVLEAHGQKITARNASNGVQFNFFLSGKEAMEGSQQIETGDSGIVLQKEEKDLLKPYAERLHSLDAFRISDILEVLDLIQSPSENINAFLQQIRNASFAANQERYIELLRLID